MTWWTTCRTLPASDRRRGVEAASERHVERDAGTPAGLRLDLQFPSDHLPVDNHDRALAVDADHGVRRELETR